MSRLEGVYQDPRLAQMVQMQQQMAQERERAMQKGLLGSSMYPMTSVLQGAFDRGRQQTVEKGPGWSRTVTQPWPPPRRKPQLLYRLYRFGRRLLFRLALALEAGWLINSLTRSAR